MISCQSKKYNKETNTIANQFTIKEQFPNHQTAFEKNGDQIVFFASGKQHEMYAKVNLKSHLFDIQNVALFNTDHLLDISHSMYFLPEKYSTFYKYPIGRSGTAGGDFFTTIEFNELGLIKSIEKNLPDSKDKYLYKYNKYGQLLKIVEDKMIDKMLLENTYDENGRLISQKKDNKDTKLEREFSYDKNDNIIKESIKEKEVASNGKVIKDGKYTLLYQYNKGQIVRKYTENEDHVIDFEYNPTGDKLISIIEYYGVLDKNDTKKWINHFTKTVYTYNDNQITEERKYEYHIINSSVFTNKKWIPITIEEQKKLGWQKFKDQSEIPLSGIEKKYSYQSNEINVDINKYSFSITLAKGKSEKNKELLDSETIKYRLDNIGRIIKQEVYNKKELVKTQEFYY
ncbi:hypothetical protein QWZ06_20735 [Chryseobacterium tructae]|uniref:YD repeat-containing protein n=1 Tax=Chryseobacterium tructae TaxID=1037380 RepID=A0ABV7Y346_9FLAO|nr:hypothetical protein [Chryseobacterium tructae]MDN3694517.1 hypothetical protein [Chryseobacterium tructae]